MMNNPKTTIAGYVAIGAAALTLAAKFVQGQPITIEDLMFALGVAGGGAGAIAAKDGGH